MFGVFLANAIMAEFGGVKIFSAAELLNINPLHLQIFGGLTVDFNLGVGALIWPVVFVVSDLINEYFGIRGVRRISFITAGLICYLFLVVLSWTKLPPAGFWLELNGFDAQGRPFDINYAYNTLFTQGLGIIAGSIADNFLILFIAFFMLGNWSLGQVIQVGIVQYTYKVAFAILLTPLLYLVHFFIDRYLGKEKSGYPTPASS